MRKYQSGSAWVFWRWSIVDSDYIRRLHIIKTPYFAVCLHFLLKPDPEPYMHDHPVSFLSIILHGGYTEKRKHGFNNARYQTHTWYNWIKADPMDMHTITEVKPGTVTLCFMGPKIREWGFRVQNDSIDQHGAKHPAGWWRWKTYYERQRAAKARHRHG